PMGSSSRAAISSVVNVLPPAGESVWTVQGAGTSSTRSASPCHAPQGTEIVWRAARTSGWLMMQQARHEGHDGVYRPEVLRHEVVVRDLHAAALLEEGDELHDAERVEHACLQQGHRVAHAGQVAGQLVRKEVADV